MRNEVTVSACHHVPSVALAKYNRSHSFSPGQRARGSLTVLGGPKSMAWYYQKVAMPWSSSISTYSRRHVCMDAGILLHFGGNFPMVNDRGTEVRGQKRQGPLVMVV